MALMDDLGNAVMREKRFLAAMLVPVSLPDFKMPRGKAEAAEVVTRQRRFRHEEIDRILRIELSQESEFDLWEYARKHGLGCERPKDFAGVRLYLLDEHIPAPGWRVVNPFNMEKSSG